MENSIDLFEYSNKVEYQGDLDSLERFLDNIWKNRDISSINYEIEERDIDRELKGKQKFISLFRDRTIKSKNYVGVIRFDNNTINLLPKIFFTGQDHPQQHTEAIQAHILWWLSYCKKFKFPRTYSSYNETKTDFFEVLIYLFAFYTRQVLSYNVHQAYEEINDELSYLKGSLNINGYIKNNLSSARWHKLTCDYDSFEVDNLFNRIIKYVSKLLLHASDSQENKRLLREIIFILDEVSDTQVSIYDCQKVKLNPLFEDMFTVLDYCKLFLANSIVLSYKNELKVYAFLLPMEYIFEDFIFGFIERHLKTMFDEVSCQKSDKYLATLVENGENKGNVFQLKHDIFLRKGEWMMIIDTKYKLIYLNQDIGEDYDRKYGVSQGDLYQVTSYAIRRGCNNVSLFYPCLLGDSQSEVDVAFNIMDEFSKQSITVMIHKLPIINELFPMYDRYKKLRDNFEHIEQTLINRLIKILKPPD